MPETPLSEVLVFLRQSEQSATAKFDALSDALHRLDQALHENNRTLVDVLKEQRLTNGRITSLEDTAVKARIALVAEQAREEERRHLDAERRRKRDEKTRSWRWWAGFIAGAIGALAAFASVVILVWEHVHP